MLYLLKHLSFSIFFFKFVSISSPSFNLLRRYMKFNFAVNLVVTSFSRQKPLTSKDKTYDCLEYKILPSWKHWAQTDKNCKISS